MTDKIEMSVAKLNEIKSKLPPATQLVAVSKTYGADTILPILEAGQRIFGENRVQESKGKWPELKATFDGVELHLIGPLQSNKAAEAVALFDVIETIDREKIANAVASEIKKQNRDVKVLVQVNTGDESQKAGVSLAETDQFISSCKNLFGEKLMGLMCIPPVDESPTKHFTLLAGLAKKHGLKILSMGMSADYEEAIKCGATHIRVGSAIFGARA